MKILLRMWLFCGSHLSCDPLTCMSPDVAGSSLRGLKTTWISSVQLHLHLPSFMYVLYTCSCSCLQFIMLFAWPCWYAVVNKLHIMINYSEETWISNKTIIFMLKWNGHTWQHAYDLCRLHRLKTVDLTQPSGGPFVMYQESEPISW